jgi:hypothetical protein
MSESGCGARPSRKPRAARCAHRTNRGTTGERRGQHADAHGSSGLPSTTAVAMTPPATKCGSLAHPGQRTQLPRLRSFGDASWPQPAQCVGALACGATLADASGAVWRPVAPAESVERGASFVQSRGGASRSHATANTRTASRAHLRPLPSRPDILPIVGRCKAHGQRTTSPPAVAPRSCCSCCIDAVREAKAGASSQPGCTGRAVGASSSSPGPSACGVVFSRRRGGRRDRRRPPTGNPDRFVWLARNPPKSGVERHGP